MSAREVPPARPDRGSASVLTLVLVGVLALAGLACAGIGGLLVGERRAATAADLAALAAAEDLVGNTRAAPQSACERARRTSRLNGARLTRCQAGPPDGRDVLVEVVVEVDLLGRRWLATGAARAGPVPAGPALP